MFKKVVSLMIVTLLLLVNLVIFPQEADAVTRVKGYMKKNGTYVQPYYRSDKNNSKFDNFSTKGNINPYSGKMGTVNPYKTTPKKYR